MAGRLRTIPPIVSGQVAAASRTRTAISFIASNVSVCDPDASCGVHLSNVATGYGTGLPLNQYAGMITFRGSLARCPWFALAFGTSPVYLGVVEHYPDDDLVPDQFADAQAHAEPDPDVVAP